MSENKLMKFNVGDKVKVIKDFSCSKRKAGEVGEIVDIDIDIDSLRLPYNVRFKTADDYGIYTLWFCDDELELEQRKQPTKNEILKEVLSDIIKSYYPHLTNIEITIKSDIEIKL